MNYKLLENLVSESKLGKAKIAALAGVSRTTLDNAIAGADIKVSTLESMSNVLGVDVAIFFGARPSMASNTATGGSISTRGDYSPASVNGNVSVDGGGKAVLEERVRMLERILEEKERTIKILMER